MALTVTPGGASDDALLSLAAFQAYCDARGYDYSSFSTTAQEQSIRKGTVWVEGVGGPTERLPTRWPGAKTSSTQRREWPRTGAAYVDGTSISSTVVPAQVEDAVAEAAWYDLNNAGELFAVLAPSDVVKSESVGGAGVRVEYRDGADVQAGRKMLTVVRDLLAPVLVPDLAGPRLYMQGIGRAFRS